MQSGKRLRELIFSASDECLGLCAARFDHQPIDRTPGSIRLEGRLFGYPSCCIESFVAHGHRHNSLCRDDQRIRFHWACPRCEVTPLLLPHYRRVYRDCRRLAAPRPQSPFAKRHALQAVTGSAG